MLAGRNNCFDIIRHFAALLVLYSHHFALSGRTEPSIHHWESFGFIAVVIFFSISGYFMFASFNNAGNFIGYMAKRCRRIFPGLIVCTFLMCYVIGTIFTSQPVLEYLSSKYTFKTYLSFATFLGAPLPGVFTDFIFPGGAINGSLWTLSIEFACYVLFGLALTLCNNRKTILILFLCAVVTCMVQKHTGKDYAFYGVPVSYLAIFGIAFTFGALMSVSQKYWFPVRGYLVLMSLILIFLMRGHPEINVFGTMGLTALTIIIGTSFQDKIINGRFDISYGIYIYAFPIQQMVINLVTQKFWLSMLISLICTIAMACLSYRFVEKPFLRSSRLKRRVEVQNSEPSPIELGNKDMA